MSTSSSFCVRCSKPLQVESGSNLCPGCLDETSRARTVLEDKPTLTHQPPREELKQFLSTQTNAGDPAQATATHVPVAPVTKPTRSIPEAPAGCEIVSRLGSGGMGDVFLVRDLIASRMLAVKYLRMTGGSYSEERFLVEVQGLARISHPNIVKVLSHDFFSATPHYVMEYIKGGTLAKYVQNEKPLLSPEAAVKLIIQAAHGVQAAHDNKVLHRDLKPNNMLITEDGIVKVSDFGLAKLLDQNNQLTDTTGEIGTPAFMCPEQVSRRHGETSPASDVYGLGASLYYLLTGKVLFKGERHELMHHVERMEPIRPRALRPEVSLAIEAVVMKCLAKKPADRYQTPAELVKNLEICLAGGIPDAQQLTVTHRAWLWLLRQRSTLIRNLLILMGIIGVIVAGILLIPVPTPVPVLKQYKTPEEQLQEIRKQIYNDLLNKKPVTLIGKRGLPIWYKCPAGPVTLGQNHPGMDGCSAQTFGTGIIELLEPPIDNYRVEFEMVILQGPQNQARASQVTCGFFMNEELTLLPAGEDGRMRVRMSLMSLGITDQDPLNVPGAMPRREVLLQSLYFPGNPGQLQNNLIGMPLTKAPWVAVPNRKLEEDWHKFVIDIAPDSIDVQFQADVKNPDTNIVLNKVDAQKLELNEKLQKIQLEGMGNLVNEKFALPQKFNPRAPIGIWLDGMEISIRNFKVTPR